MSEKTVNLALPYIMPAQAQKHVTHNEALQRLDATAQLVITARQASPPALPTEGECFWVLAGATGPWSGRTGRLAFRQDGEWLFIVPQVGWCAFDRSDERLKIFSGADWIDTPLPATVQVTALGVGATPDSANRLAVSAAATLLTHAGDDHRLKINKAASGNTASLLFQSGWQGKAEMGLAGDDRFSVKVSPDGAAWTTALAITPQGVVRTEQRPLARAARTAGPLLALSTRHWMPAASAARAMTPPSASISFTRWPLPMPPMAGLQLIAPTVSMLWVSSSVRTPARAAASAASVPACPPPMTMTSKR